MHRGQRLTLTIERPAAGGRMIARHDGAIVFVAGAIPGEVVDAEVEKIQRGTGWAVTREVLQASPDRLEAAADLTCGGSVLAHIRYERQLALKAEIIVDAFRRVGRITLDAPPDVAGSPVDGYRMRSRLHVREGRIGFFREGTHVLCDAASTRQLTSGAVETVRALERALSSLPPESVADVTVAENVDASERALHVDLLQDVDLAQLAGVTQVAGVTGVSCARLDGKRTQDLWGVSVVTDTLHGVTLGRHARSFFQGNRFLLSPLVDHVLAQIDAGPVLDLYAGAGLFSLTASAAGHGPVTAVEGDPIGGADLRRNAALRTDVTVRLEAVEDYLSRGPEPAHTVVVDPPRTGLSKVALAGVIALRARRLVYVSCDVATLARDARMLLDAGYRLAHVRAFDLFPNTAHVETVIVCSR